jgi:exonuclease III
VRLPQVLDWLAAQPSDAPVDVLALQELKLTDDKFPAHGLPGRRLCTRSGSARRPTTAWPC